MKVYTCIHKDLVLLAVAFNRGQAVKLIAKKLEEHGRTLTKDDKVMETDPESEEYKRGAAIVLNE